MCLYDGLVRGPSVRRGSFVRSAQASGTNYLAAVPAAVMVAVLVTPLLAAPVFAAPLFAAQLCFAAGAPFVAVAVRRVVDRGRDVLLLDAHWLRGAPASAGSQVWPLCNM